MDDTAGTPLSADKPLELWVIHGVVAGTDTADLAGVPIRVERASADQILAHPIVTELLETPDEGESLRYAIDALVTDLDEWFKNDTQEWARGGGDGAYDKLIEIRDELKELR